MNKLVITVLLLFALLMGGSLIASCAAQEITTTVTGTSGTTTIIIGKEPPEIPHAYLVVVPGVPYIAGGEPVCFTCHPVPPDHEGWWLDETLCDECHEVSDNPILFQ